MAEFRCAAVILAAGASTRLGQAKQLVQIEGESLLRRSARLAVEAGCTPVFVVLGFEAEKMRAELAGLPVDAVVNPRWQEGMGASLGAGVDAVRSADPMPDAVLVLVCDQLRLRIDHLRTLVARHESAGAERAKSITASVYAGRTGVPAVFASGLFSELAALGGDRGARELIRSHEAEVQGIPWPEGEWDLDRPEDLATIER